MWFTISRRWTVDGGIFATHACAISIGIALMMTPWEKKRSCVVGGLISKYSYRDYNHVASFLLQSSGWEKIQNFQSCCCRNSSAIAAIESRRTFAIDVSTHYTLVFSHQMSMTLSEAMLMMLMIGHSNSWRRPPQKALRRDFMAIGKPFSS